MVGEYNPNVALIMAAKEGNLDEIKQALKNGADIDVEDFNNAGFTAAMHAAYKGYEDCLKELIKNGADIEVTDIFSDNPLSLATARGNFECVKILIEAGANVDIIYARNDNMNYHTAREIYEDFIAEKDKAKQQQENKVNIQNKHQYLRKHLKNRKRGPKH